MKLVKLALTSLRVDFVDSCRLSLLVIQNAQHVFIRNVSLKSRARAHQPPAPPLPARQQPVARAAVAETFLASTCVRASTILSIKRTLTQTYFSTQNK